MSAGESLNLKVGTSSNEPSGEGVGAIWGQCKNSAYHLFSRVLTLTQNIRYHEYRGGKILRSVPSFYAKIESVIVGVMSALGAGYKQAEPRHARDGVF